MTDLNDQLDSAVDTVKPAKLPCALEKFGRLVIGAGRALEQATEI
jgi:hypothetical protein